MQDIHSIGGGHLFGGGDRRLRPHHNQNHQALKCPRCDSLNTKFCYYNNYNLSQPRHFCKSCRRYWTKGGVLRNVPVGGGCRKTKRSKPKPSTSDTATAAPPRERKSNSHSSSESSSLTATTTTTTTEAVSGLSAPSASSNAKFLNIHDSNHFTVHSANPNPSFEPTLLEQGSDCGIFSEIGTFTSLITSSTDSLAFGFSNLSDISGFRLNQQGQEQVQQNQWHQQQQQQQQQKMVCLGGEELKMQEITGGMIDQTVQVELSALQNRSNGGFGSLDWQPSGDQGLFDLPNTVDQSYWSQSQWTDQDHPTLYLP